MKAGVIHPDWVSVEDYLPQILGGAHPEWSEWADVVVEDAVWWARFDLPSETNPQVQRFLDLQPEFK